MTTHSTNFSLLYVPLYCQLHRLRYLPMDGSPHIQEVGPGGHRGISATNRGAHTSTHQARINYWLSSSHSILIETRRLCFHPASQMHFYCPHQVCDVARPASITKCKVVRMKPLQSFMCAPTCKGASVGRWLENRQSCKENSDRVSQCMLQSVFLPEQLTLRDCPVIHLGNGR